MDKLNPVPVKSCAQGESTHAAKAVYSNFNCHKKTALVFKQQLCPGGTINQRQHDRHLYRHLYQHTLYHRQRCTGMKSKERVHAQNSPSITFRTFLACQQSIASVLQSALLLMIGIRARKHTSL